MFRRLAAAVLFATALVGQSVPWAKFDRARSNNPVLTSAVAALGTKGVICPPAGAYTISADTTIPVGITFAPDAGAVYTINNGITLTINGPAALLPTAQYFALVGTGKVVFSSTSSIDAYYPNWWGAKGDSNAGNSYAGTNCTAAIQAAIDAACLNPRNIQFLDGIYYVNAKLALPDSTSHPYISIGINGTNNNQNSSYARGNCCIEFNGTELFVPKSTTYTTTRADATAYTVGTRALWSTGLTVWECTTAGTSTTGAPSIAGKVVGDTLVDGTVTWTCRWLGVNTIAVMANITNLSFFSHNTSGPTLFAHLNFSTGRFERNHLVGWGICFTQTGGVCQIAYNKFLGQRDSVNKMEAGQYGADTWFHHNYVNGNSTLGTVVGLQVYGSASWHITDNYFDFMKTGIWVYYAGSSSAGKLEISSNTFDILYRGILIQTSNEISIGLNVFRRCNLASRAYMTANPATAWGSIEITTNSYNITAVGNNYSDVDSWITLTGNGIWNVTESANVGTVGAWPMIDWTGKTYDTGTYPLDGQRIISTSRGQVRKTGAIAYTVLPSDDYLVYTGAGGVAYTLPRAYLGRTVRIYNQGGGTLTITPTGGDTCNVATLTTGQSKEFIASGTVWEAN